MMTIGEALQKIQDWIQPSAMVAPAVYQVGNVTIDRTHVLRGVVPCPYCGEAAGMGTITVRHADGRAVSFNPRLFHYTAAGHPITAADVDGDTLVAIVASV